jgi:hypothetical protein
MKDDKHNFDFSKGIRERDVKWIAISPPPTGWWVIMKSTGEVTQSSDLPPYKSHESERR